MQPPSLPTLVFDKPEIQATLGVCYTHALDNILRINVIKAEAGQKRTGLIVAPETFLRAGGDYQEPWTRDASVNSWNAVSLLQPTLAANTLWAVCDKRPDGKIEVQNDNQWWDKIIWVIAAWNHYATNGDKAFLKQSYETATLLADDQIKTRFDKEFGLFQGPSHLQDGIAGYPAPFNDPPGTSSFILDHPGSSTIMTLSVNSLYVQAFRSLAKMATELKQDKTVAKAWTQRADALREAINTHFWIPEKKSYAYLLFGEGELRGKQAKYQEGTGISLVVLAGVPDAARAREVVKNVRTTAYGIPLVDPEFERYSVDKPGRHSFIIWPLAQGYWGAAAAKVGNIARFRFETEALVGLVKSTDWNFYEIYNAQTGKIDGGWQNGNHWGSCTNQTWSASSYIRLVHYGLFGMDFSPSGISFAPNLPKEWGAVRLSGLRYREAILDIRLVGSGRRVIEFWVDGKPFEKPSIPSNLKGKHTVEIRLR